MDELEFPTVTKYLDGLKQELQDEIVGAIWDIGTIAIRAKKLEELDYSEILVSYSYNSGFTRST